MVAVAQSGTSAKVFAGAGYTSGGKTGTAQAVTIGQHEKYNAARMEERQRDHSLYIAFAPAESPSIVLALIVENAGFGAASAAPIARRVFDYWIKGQYPNPDDMQAVRKGQAGAPMGTPLNAAEVPWPRASAAVAASAALAAIPSTPSMPVAFPAKVPASGSASAPASPASGN
jgi:penicillin-binding protein 2